MMDEFTKRRVLFGRTRAGKSKFAAEHMLREALCGKSKSASTHSV